MKLSLSDRIQFISYAIHQHLGFIGIGLVFLVFGGFFVFLGLRVDDGKPFIIIGGLLALLPNLFLLYTLPSSFLFYYEKAYAKKHGRYTVAEITNKRIDDYSHKSGLFNNGTSKNVEQFLYVIEFKFSHNNKDYESECFFEHQSTFDAIPLDLELPIKYLRTNPKVVHLRRRKLSNLIGIPERMCR